MSNNNESKLQYRKQKNGFTNDYPLTACVFLNDYLIASEPATNSLKIIDRLTFKHLGSLGTSIPGLELGQFHNPGALCVQPSTKHLIVCDKKNDRLQVLSLDDHEPTLVPLFSIGRRSTTLLYKSDNFTAVCCSPNGEIFVTDSYNNRIQSFDETGRFLSTLYNTRHLINPRNICYVHPQFFWSSAASGMICVGDGNCRISLWATGNHNSDSSSFRRIFEFSINEWFSGMCVDLKGYLHVSCGWESHNINIYDFRMMSSANTARSALVQILCEKDLYFPLGICVDDKNILAVTYGIGNRIQFFDECCN